MRKSKGRKRKVRKEIVPYQEIADLLNKTDLKHARIYIDSKRVLVYGFSLEC